MANKRFSGSGGSSGSSSGEETQQRFQEEERDRPPELDTQDTGGSSGDSGGGSGGSFGGGTQRSRPDEPGRGSGGGADTTQDSSVSGGQNGNQQTSSASTTPTTSGPGSRAQTEAFLEESGEGAVETAVAEQNANFDVSDIEAQQTESGFDVRVTEQAARRQAAAQNPNVSPSDIELDRREGGGFDASLTSGALREQARQQVAAQNEGIQPGDVQATVQEDTFVSGGDARLAQEAGTDAESLRQDTVGVSLTPDAQRDLLRTRAEEQYPNAEDIDIVGEPGDFRAEVERQSASDEFVGGIENALRNPETIGEGTVETVEGAVGRGATVGQNAIDTVTNPRETAGEVGVFIDEGTTRLERNVTSFAGDPLGSIEGAAENRIETGEEELADLRETGGNIFSGVSEFAGETAGRVGESQAGQAAIAAAPVAAAEPTPVGEIGVGTALAGATLGAAGTVAFDQATQTREATVNQQDRTLDRSGVAGITGTEIEVPERRQPVQETEIGVPEGGVFTQGEMQTPSAGAVVGGAEIAAPEGTEPVETTEVDVPQDFGTRDPGEPIQMQQLFGEAIQEQQQTEDDPRRITEEDIFSERPEPDQPGPSVREQMQRDDLFTPAREFFTGESAVVGRQTADAGDTTQGAQERVSEAQESRVGQGMSSDQMLFGGVANRTETMVGADVAQDAQQAQVTDQLQGLEQAQAQFSQPSVQENAAVESPAFGTSPGLGFGQGFGVGTSVSVPNRPQLPEMELGGSPDDSDDEGGPSGTEFTNPVASGSAFLFGGFGGGGDETPDDTPDVGGNGFTAMFGMGQDETGSQDAEGIFGGGF